MSETPETKVPPDGDEQPQNPNDEVKSIFTELKVSMRGETPEAKAKFDEEFLKAKKEHDRKALQRLAKLQLEWKAQQSNPPNN